MEGLVNSATFLTRLTLSTDRLIGFTEEDRGMLTRFSSVHYLKPHASCSTKCHNRSSSSVLTRFSSVLLIKNWLWSCSLFQAQLLVIGISATPSEHHGLHVYKLRDTANNSNPIGVAVNSMWIGLWYCLCNIVQFNM
ncbi:putative serine/threonine-protein kinase isoform X2 [Iris pallida]|uniref:Serine/threonine-protein kinase isoform X2 n=1 Tax=Iris pallida TaxID=29817 RepID=A0AAX6F7J2_IRIPA|nr:putative serine/threonine-protein kinase isoform X2 [Iris pallida]